MNFDELQQEWRKEMEMTPALKNFSIEQVASFAQKTERESRFAGFVFAGVAIAILALAAFLLLTNSIPATPWKLLELLGIPALYFYISWMYFNAVRKPEGMDWSLTARIRSEKEKLTRQVSLSRKLPTHMLLPIFIITLVGKMPGMLDSPSSAAMLKTTLFVASMAVFLVIVAWVVKRNSRIKLQPMLDRITRLEEQLSQ